MEKKIAKATIRKLPSSAQKLRLVVDLVRGKDVIEAQAILKYLNKKGAKLVLKGLNSAVSNAKDVLSATPEELVISHISVDSAAIRKTGRAASRGRYVTLQHRSSHLNLELSKK